MNQAQHRDTMNVEVDQRGKAAISPRKILFRKLKNIGLVLLSLFIVWTLYTQWKIAEAGGEARLSDPADVGIVLGASLWGNAPSPGLKERLDLVVEQYNAGRFDDIIVTGGYDSSQSELSEAEGSKLYLMEQGVPEARIWLEPNSTSTLENLQFSKSIMDEHDWNTATIMTHSFHGTRAREIAEALDYDAIEVVTVKSKVLSPIWHPMRETLAYTKWKWDELWL
ncbi:YdcF family protein [Paenibacillus marinisediminis]